MGGGQILLTTQQWLGSIDVWACSYFQMLVELKGDAPVVVLHGEPDVGKTIVANAAMSVSGIEACSFPEE